VHAHKLCRSEHGLLHSTGYYTQSTGDQDGRRQLGAPISAGIVSIDRATARALRSTNELNVKSVSGSAARHSQRFARRIAPVFDNPNGTRLSPMSWVRPVTYVSGLDTGWT
jgi:hypothetical protein